VGVSSTEKAVRTSFYDQRGTVDHTVYDATSILKLITRRFALEPLPGVRKKIGDLTAAFAFGSWDVRVGGPSGRPRR
jgi:phospholipase C